MNYAAKHVPHYLRALILIKAVVYIEWGYKQIHNSPLSYGYNDITISGVVPRTTKIVD
jgi:hypothetical protein